MKLITLTKEELAPYFVKTQKPVCLITGEIGSMQDTGAGMLVTLYRIGLDDSGCPFDEHADILFRKGSEGKRSMADEAKKAKLQSGFAIMVLALCEANGTYTAIEFRYPGSRTNANQWKFHDESGKAGDINVVAGWMCNFKCGSSGKSVHFAIPLGGGASKKWHRIAAFRKDEKEGKGPAETAEECSSMKTEVLCVCGRMSEFNGGNSYVAESIEPFS